MFRRSLPVVAVLIAGLVPLAHAQVPDADARCKSELTSRGFPGSFERVQVNGSIVTGIVRTGNDALAFSCMVDNSGNVSEVRVDRSADRTYGVRTDPAPADADYSRGYRDGAVRSPYNNYRNSSAYDQGYEEGYQSRRRR